MSSEVVIDMHVHAAGIGAGYSGCYVSPGMRRNWRYQVFLKAFGLNERELQTKGDKIVFERISQGIASSEMVSAAVVLALDGVVDHDGELNLDQTEIYIPNDFVEAETEKYPNLIFGASVNPHRHDALERLEHVAASGAVLVKWLPPIQKIDPSDTRHIPFYHKLKELNLALLTHAGSERSFTKAEARLGDPQLLRLPLESGVKVIAAHAATTGKSEGEDNMQRLLRMFPDYPNLFADISSLTQANKLRYLPRLLQDENALERLVYGTDFPLINTPLVSPRHYPFRLSRSQKAEISQMPNPWDRDVMLKKALLVPPEVFTRSGGLLGFELPKHGQNDLLLK